MAVAVFKTFLAGEVLTAADLNSSFSQITDNGQDVPFPRTESADFDGYEIILDGDADTSITADTDDRIDLKLRGVDLFRFDGATGGTTVNGLDFIASATTAAVQVATVGSDSNIALNLVTKGTGALQHDGVAILTVAGGTLTGGLTLGGAVAMGGFEITGMDTVPSADAVAIGREYGLTGSSITFTIADDNVVRIDGLVSYSFVYVTLNGGGGDNTNQNGAVYFQPAFDTSTLFGGSDFAHIADSDTPPAEGSSGGTDSKLNFQANTTGTAMLWIKNRLGGTVTVRLWVMGNTYSTAVLTATQL